MSRVYAHSGMYRSMYSLGLMDKWKTPYMKGGSYLTAIQIDDYKVEYVEDADDLQLTIWNPDRPCIVIVLIKELETAVLNLVEYDTRCTVDGRMERGTGTRKMINFAIKLIKEKGAKNIQLDDRSTTICNGNKIKLGPMYFFRTGQTWYEKYFGFQPVRHKELYAKAKEIRKTLDLDDKPCDYFTDDVVYELGRKTGFDRVINDAWELVL